MEQIFANILPFCPDSCRCPCRRPLLYDPLAVCERSILENSAFMPAIVPTLPTPHSRHISPLYNVGFSFLPPSLITTHTHTHTQLRFSSLHINRNKRKSFWSADIISLIYKTALFTLLTQFNCSYFTASRKDSQWNWNYFLTMTVRYYLYVWNVFL